MEELELHSEHIGGKHFRIILFTSSKYSSPTPAGCPNSLTTSCRQQLKMAAATGFVTKPVHVDISVEAGSVFSRLPCPLYHPITHAAQEPQDALAIYGFEGCRQQTLLTFTFGLLFPLAYPFTLMLVLCLSRTVLLPQQQ